MGIDDGGSRSERGIGCRSGSAGRDFGEDDDQEENKESNGDTYGKGFVLIDKSFYLFYFFLVKVSIGHVNLS